MPMVCTGAAASSATASSTCGGAEGSGWARDRLHQLVLDELSEAEMIDWSRGCVDSVSVRRKGGRADRAQPHRSRQARHEVPPVRRRHLLLVVGAGCVGEGRRADGEGPGFRSLWCCQIEPTALSSSGVWPPPGRSAAAQSADHAGLPSPAKQQVSRREPSIGHPQARRVWASTARVSATRASADTSTSATASTVRRFRLRTGVRRGGLPVSPPPPRRHLCLPRRRAVTGVTPPPGHDQPPPVREVFSLTSPQARYLPI
jgi:hypothetical protein